MTIGTSPKPKDQETATYQQNGSVTIWHRNLPNGSNPFRFKVFDILNQSARIMYIPMTIRWKGLSCGSSLECTDHAAVYFALQVSTIHKLEPYGKLPGVGTLELVNFMSNTQV